MSFYPSYARFLFPLTCTQSSLELQKISQVQNSVIIIRDYHLLCRGMEVQSMKQPHKTSKMNEQQATNFCHQQPSLAVYLIIKSDREGKVASFTVSSSKGTFFFFFNAVSLLPCCRSFHRLCKVYGLICPLVSSAAMPRSCTQVFHVLFLPLFPYKKVLSFKSILK